MCIYIYIYSFFQANVISGTSFQITNLTPATIYNVIVSTVNDKGSSLPELTLILVTEGVTGDDTTPFNETGMCLQFISI